MYLSHHVYYVHAKCSLSHRLVLLRCMSDALYFQTETKNYYIFTAVPIHVTYDFIVNLSTNHSLHYV